MKRSALLLLATGFLVISMQQSAHAQFQKKRYPVAKSSWKMEYVQPAFGGVQPDPPKPPDELWFGAPQFHDDDVVSSTPTIPLPPPKELVEEMLLEDIADELGVGVDELLDDGMFQELRELERLMKDLEQAFQFPEMQDGLPGGSDPSVDGIQERVAGDEASLDEILFGRQGPRWNGTGTGVGSFDMNEPGTSGYPSAESGPSGNAAPSIRPFEDSMDELVVLDHGDYVGPDFGIDVVLDEFGREATRLFRDLSSWMSLGGQWIFPSPAGDFPDDATYGDDQPNPEGNDDGGPIKGDSNDTLDWLAGRSPRSRNPATAPRIGTLDVLGQPGSEEGRYRTATPNRFSRMRDDIDPAMMSSGADGGSSERPPIGPKPDDPDSPIGPDDPSPVK